MNIFDSASISRQIDDLIDRNISLPKYIFKKKYSDFLFFDVDVLSDQEFIRHLEEVWRATGLIKKSPDLYFCASDKETKNFIKIDLEESWNQQILGFAEFLHSSGVYSGGILFTDDGKFSLYQQSPVAVGVTALDTNDVFFEKILSNLENEWFFSVKELNNKDRRRSLSEAFGYDWIRSLEENYLAGLR